MDVIYFISILAIIIGYLNLFLIIRKDKPKVIINNYLKPDSSVSKEDRKYNKENNKISEVPADTKINIKDVKGKSNISNERIGNASNVTSTSEKIKNLRKKK